MGSDRSKKKRDTAGSQQDIYELCARVGVAPGALDEPSLLLDALKRAHEQLGFYRDTVLRSMEACRRLEQENERMACRLAWMEELLGKCRQSLP